MINLIWMVIFHFSSNTNSSMFNKPFLWIFWLHYLLTESSILSYDDRFVAANQQSSYKQLTFLKYSGLQLWNKPVYRTADLPHIKLIYKPLNNEQDRNMNDSESVSLPRMVLTAPCWLNPPNWSKTFCLLFFNMVASTKDLKHTHHTSIKTHCTQSVTDIHGASLLCVSLIMQFQVKSSQKYTQPTEYLLGLLDAVQVKGDTSCGFSAEAKATQPLSLQPHREVKYSFITDRE